MSLKTKLQEAAVAVEDLRRQLAEAERNYDALFKQATGGAKAKRLTTTTTQTTTPQPQVPTANFTDRIVALLSSNTEKEWSYGEIKKALPDIPDTTTPSLLFRLKKQGKVMKVGRGKWKVAG
jgi:hypothetical protein